MPRLIIKGANGAADPMDSCKYLMMPNASFCRLKGQRNPRCQNCKVKATRDAGPPDQGWARWLKRIRLP